MERYRMKHPLTALFKQRQGKTLFHAQTNRRVNKEAQSMEPKLLIVDDEEKVRKYLSSLLRNRGYQVDTAPDGISALEMVSQSDFDLVLLDVIMPGPDGLEVLQEIKRRKPHTEVIMLTGNASVNTGVEGMRLGAFDYLLKPLDLKAVTECLDEALKWKRFREKGASALDIPEMGEKPPKNKA
jgi:DNA-binding NtrC family response regulator